MFFISIAKNLIIIQFKKVFSLFIIQKQQPQPDEELSHSNLRTESAKTTRKIPKLKRQINFLT